MKRSLAIAAVSVLLAGGAATAAVVAKDGRHHHRPKATTTLPVVTTRPAVTTTTRPATTTTAPVTTTTVCGFGPGPAGPVKSSCVSLPQVNVKAAPYNAVCNGSGDDTTAVQAAANDSAGKMLYFPAGTCRVAQINIPTNASVTGVGPSSILKPITLPSFSRYDSVFDVGSNVSIASLKIDGNGTVNMPDSWSDSYNNFPVSGNNYTGGVGRGRGYRAGIRSEGQTGLTVDSVEFTNVAGAAVATNNSSSVTVKNSNLHDSAWELVYAFGSTSPTFVSTSGTSFTITGNTMTSIHSPAAANSSGFNPDSLVLSRVNGFTIANNSLDGIDRDFLKLESSKNGTVSGNTAANGNPAIDFAGMQISPMFGHHDVTSDSIRVTGNTFTGPGWHNGIQVNSDDSLSAITRNIEVDHNTVSGVPFGIQADGTVGLFALSIHDNMFATISSTEIWVSGGGTGGLSVSGNVKAGPTALSNQPFSTPGAFSNQVFT